MLPEYKNTINLKTIIQCWNESTQEKKEFQIQQMKNNVDLIEKLYLFKDNVDYAKTINNNFSNEINTHLDIYFSLTQQIIVEGEHFTEKFTSIEYKEAHKNILNLKDSSPENVLAYSQALQYEHFTEIFNKTLDACKNNVDLLMIINFWNSITKDKNACDLKLIKKIYQ